MPHAALRPRHPQPDIARVHLLNAGDPDGPDEPTGRERLAKLGAGPVSRIGEHAAELDAGAGPTTAYLSRYPEGITALLQRFRSLAAQFSTKVSGAAVDWSS